MCHKQINQKQKLNFKKLYFMCHMSHVTVSWFIKPKTQIALFDQISLGSVVSAIAQTHRQRTHKLPDLETLSAQSSY